MASTLSVGTTQTNLVDVPVEPDTFSWGLQDISASDAGRTEDADNRMHKNRTSQKRKVQLGWNNPTFAQASAIVQMFNPEYVFVRYLDLLSGGWRIAEFYTGDKSAPFRQIALNDPSGNKTVVSTLTFDIVEV